MKYEMIPSMVINTIPIREYESSMGHISTIVSVESTREPVKPRTRNNRIVAWNNKIRSHMHSIEEQCQSRTWSLLFLSQGLGVTS